MIKFCFWLLLAANLVLFVFQQTYFDAPTPGKREPERIAYQYREEAIRVLTEDEVKRSLQSGKHQGTAQTAQADNFCLEIGGFSKEEASRFERHIPAFELNSDSIHLLTVKESSTFMVYISPEPGSQAEARITELKNKGIENYYLIREQGPYKGAISLGIFKNRDAAANFSAELTAKGIQGIEVGPRGNTVDKLIYRLEQVSSAKKDQLKTLMLEFPAQSIKQCATDSDTPA